MARMDSCHRVVSEHQADKLGAFKSIQHKKPASHVWRFWLQTGPRLADLQNGASTNRILHNWGLLDSRPFVGQGIKNRHLKVADISSCSLDC